MAMKVRRIVTGHNSAGKAVVKADVILLADDRHAPELDRQLRLAALLTR